MSLSHVLMDNINTSRLYKQELEQTTRMMTAGEQASISESTAALTLHKHDPIQGIQQVAALQQ